MRDPCPSSMVNPSDPAPDRVLTDSRCLVLGATGSVGRLVAAHLASTGGGVLVASRSASAALAVASSIDGTEAVMIDVADPKWAVPDGVSIVIDCTGSDRLDVAVRACESNSSYVSISASIPHVQRLFDLGPRIRSMGGGVVVGAGLAPGISTMLAHRLLTDDLPGDVRIDLVLDAFDSFGSMATTFTTELIGATFSDPHTGRSVRNFSAPSTIEAPAGFGKTTTGRVGFADTTILATRLGRPVSVHFGLTQLGGTRLLGLLGHGPPAVTRRAISLSERFTGTSNSRPWLCMASDGIRRVWATGTGQASATAAHIELIVRRLTASGRQPGVVAAHDLAPLDNASSEHLRRAGIAIAIDLPPWSDQGEGRSTR